MLQAAGGGGSEWSLTLKKEPSLQGDLLHLLPLLPPLLFSQMVVLHLQSEVVWPLLPPASANQAFLHLLIIYGVCGGPGDPSAHQQTPVKHISLYFTLAGAGFAPHPDRKQCK